MSLSQDERNKIHLRIREFSITGDPISAAKLRASLEADEAPDPTLMAASGIHADIPLKTNIDLEIPPRWGKGSGKDNWVEFAAVVTDIDEEVLSRMTRDDIVATLEARGNIPSA